MITNNVSNQYRIGLKSLMDLYPSRVRDKILADAKLKKFDEHNKKALADVAREITDFEGKNSSEYFTFFLPLMLYHSIKRPQTSTTSASKTSS
jgi:hypothetical protein